LTIGGVGLLETDFIPKVTSNLLTKKAPGFILLMAQSIQEPLFSLNQSVAGVHN